MRLQTRRTMWALGLWLGVIGLSWLARSAQAERAALTHAHQPGFSSASATLPSYSPARTATAPDSGAARSLQGAEATQYLKERGLYDRLRDSLEASRYEINWQQRTRLPELGGAYEAANPEQGLRAYFTPTEVRLAPDACDQPGGARAQAWRFGMKLRGYGYGK